MIRSAAIKLVCIPLDILGALAIAAGAILVGLSRFISSFDPHR